MRPTTVAEACRLVKDGAPWDRTMGDFLQAFYTAETVGKRGAMLAGEPPLLGDARYDALIGGIAEYLFKRFSPGFAPGWIANRDRYLDEPWFPNVGDDPGLREYLTYSSPPEFKSRNIMTDSAPLRRAADRRPRAAPALRGPGRTRPA